MDLFVFSRGPDFARRVMAAGGAAVVVDWERRRKHRRQAGADTEINGDTAGDLASVRAATAGPVVCRVNGWDRWTAQEIDLAVALGADEVLLPMVRRAEEVDAALGRTGGRCDLGILVETTDAVRHVAELARRPLSRVYVGLNDLMIDRGATSLFAPLLDGTVERVRQVVGSAGIPFGVAGLTVPEGGRPVPCRLLIGELARMGTDFTFLRRSFQADTAGRDLAVEVPRILEAVEAARHRSGAEVAADRAQLAATVGLVAVEEAV
ncbi:MAG TPA: aldolase/citrate lyase family protein [Acidimicrobiales bacterium]|nr:aldolase/citrate lyase family protein [Acidimicrobiales bacterium]